MANPRPEPTCGACGAPNDPDARECWLCDRSDWRFIPRHARAGSSNRGAVRAPRRTVPGLPPRTAPARPNGLVALLHRPISFRWLALPGASWSAFAVFHLPWRIVAFFSVLLIAPPLIQPWMRRLTTRASAREVLMIAAFLAILALYFLRYLVHP